MCIDRFIIVRITTLWCVMSEFPFSFVRSIDRRHWRCWPICDINDIVVVVIVVANIGRKLIVRLLQHLPRSQWSCVVLIIDSSIQSVGSVLARRSLFGLSAAKLASSSSSSTNGWLFVCLFVVVGRVRRLR
jgi:hypothetical protein